MSPRIIPDLRPQLLAHIAMLFSKPGTTLDVITYKDSTTHKYQAVAVQFFGGVKESKELLSSEKDMPTRDHAYLSLLNKVEEILDEKKKEKRVKTKVDVHHVEEIVNERNDREEYDFVERPTQSEVKIVTEARYEYPPGSGDEWAYYASAHLRSQQGTIVPASVAPTPLTSPNHGCPLGSDDEWMYWWSKSLEDKDKAAMEAANAIQSSLPVSKNGCPNGSNDEWAYWVEKSQEDRKRGCPNGSNDEWAYWVAESLKKKDGSVRGREKKVVHRRAKTPNRQCPYGTDDQWAYWAWRHSEGMDDEENAVEVETTKTVDIEGGEEVEVEVKTVRDFPPGSGDLWAHFDKLFVDKEYAARYHGSDSIRRDMKKQNVQVDVSNGDGEAKKSKTSTSAYAVWLSGLNIE